MTSILIRDFLGFTSFAGHNTGIGGCSPSSAFCKWKQHESRSNRQRPTGHVFKSISNNQQGDFDALFYVHKVMPVIQSLLNTSNKFQNTNTPLFGTLNTFCTGNLEVSATLTVAISSKTASSSYWSFCFLRVTVRICDPQLSDSSPSNAHTVAGMPQMLLISSDRRLKNARTSVFG